MSQLSGSEAKPGEGGPSDEVLGQFFSSPLEKSRVKVMARFRPPNEIELKMDEYNLKILREMKQQNSAWDSSLIAREKKIQPRVQFDDENPQLVSIVDNLTSK